MKVVLVTSGQPSVNPRLVKEADALSDAGYDVTVIYAYWNKWATQYDQQLINNRKWKAIQAGGDPVNARLIYFISRLLYKIARLTFTKFNWLAFADLAIARGSYFLMRETTRHKADLYIGHNLGALPAIVKAAAVHKKPCGFDAEDFHRNEVSNDPQSKDVILKSYIEDKYFPYVNYLTVSSPQIGLTYKKLFPGSHPVTVLNVFPTGKITDVSTVNSEQPIKLFWFSQTIGTKRGIEDVIKALTILDSNMFELHLLGQVSSNFHHQLSELTEGFDNIKLFFHHPTPADQLITFASTFDIGLALEPAFSVNNDFALSNKIFTYLQAGLAIIASDTTAQRELLSQYPYIGEVYPRGNAQALAAILIQYQQNKALLFKHKKASLHLAMERLNWETESKKFLQLVENTIGK